MLLFSSCQKHIRYVWPWSTWGGDLLTCQRPAAFSFSNIRFMPLLFSWLWIEYLWVLTFKNVFLTAAGLWKSTWEGGDEISPKSCPTHHDEQFLTCCTEAFKQISDGHMKTGELSVLSLRCCSPFMKAPSSEEPERWSDALAHCFWTPKEINCLDSHGH